jgi:hypothetical protein
VGREGHHTPVRSPAEADHPEHRGADLDLTDDVHCLRMAHKEVYCENCGSNQPMIEPEPQKDNLNPYPWYDILCGTCYFVIATVQVVPDDKPIEPSRAVEYNEPRTPAGKSV